MLPPRRVDDIHPMPLSAAGHPAAHAHAVRHAEPRPSRPRSTFAAYMLDLRKRGFAPVGGDLQGTGHHPSHAPRRRASIAPPRASSASVRRCRAVAFEATPAHRRRELPRSDRPRRPPRRPVAAATATRATSAARSAARAAARTFSRSRTCSGRRRAGVCRRRAPARHGAGAAPRASASSAAT